MGTVGLAAVCAVVARGLVRSTVTGREERGAGCEELGERFVVAGFAYGFVVQVRGGVDEGVWHRGAGEGAVDEESAGGGGALQAAVFLFVVEDELVAQAAGGDCEVGGKLVGVGAVGGQQSGGQSEAVGGEPGQGVHGVRADAFAGGVQDQAEGELGVAADAFTGPPGAVGVTPAGGDEEGGGVSEDALFSASAVVPARGEIDGGELATAAGRVVPGRDRGGVGADVAGPAREQAVPVGELDGDQDKAVADLLQQGPAADVFGIVVLPGRGDDGGFGGGQAPAALAAARVQGGGQPVEGAVDTAGESEPGVCVGAGEVGNAEPGAGGGPQVVGQDPVGVGEVRAVAVVQGQQQAHQDRAHREAVRAGAALKFLVDQGQDARIVQQRIKLADLRVRDHWASRPSPGSRPSPAPGCGRRRRALTV
jgi:hypothetical protein